ncbi:MAG: DUF6722 family protein [Bacteroidales bacterium]
MKKELGKWLMDIAKYITTAVILTSIFGKISDKYLLYIVAFLSVGSCLGWGLWLVKTDKPASNHKFKHINKKGVK